MNLPFDYSPDRPEHIENILNGLDRYNPETTSVFQDYVQQQCEDRTYDCYANLALLKLYQFNPHLARDETITNILVKSLLSFPSPDFSLSLHLLPPHILSPTSTTHATPAAGDAPLSEAVQKLHVLHTHLDHAAYDRFWATLDGDDLYADLIADVSGFEEGMRGRIAACIGQGTRRVEVGWAEKALDLSGAGALEAFAKGVGWKVVDGEGDKGEKGKWVEVPINKENEAKGTVVRENVRFEQFSRMVHRAYEQPA